MSDSPENSTRYVEACTDLIDGACQAFAWVPMPGDSQYSIADAVLISGAIAGVWAVGAVFRLVSQALISHLRY